MEINLGPFGEIDDRFIVRHTKNRFVKALLPGIDLPEEIEGHHQEEAARRH
jgi:hypothetical protein